MTNIVQTFFEEIREGIVANLDEFIKKYDDQLTENQKEFLESKVLDYVSDVELN